MKVVVSDPPKGMNDDISGADVYFLQIHVPTEDDGTQDLTQGTPLGQLLTPLHALNVHFRGRAERI